MVNVLKAIEILEKYHSKHLLSHWIIYNSPRNTLSEVQIWESRGQVRDRNYIAKDYVNLISVINDCWQKLRAR